LLRKNSKESLYSGTLILVGVSPRGAEGAKPEKKDD
jgi:hypothetical protein